MLQATETKLDLREIAREFIQRHESKDDARQAMRDWIAANIDDIASEVIEIAANAMIEDARHRENRANLKGKEIVPENESERLKASRNGVESTIASRLMNWTVAGTVLRRCNRELLAKAATDNRSQASGNMANAIWFESIAAKLNGNETVGGKLKESQLKRMRESAEKKAASTCGV